MAVKASQKTTFLEPLKANFAVSTYNSWFLLLPQETCDRQGIIWDLTDIHWPWLNLQAPTSGGCAPASGTWHWAKIGCPQQSPAELTSQDPQELTFLKHWGRSRFELRNARHSRNIYVMPLRWGAHQPQWSTWDSACSSFFFFNCHHVFGVIVLKCVLSPKVLTMNQFFGVSIALEYGDLFLFPCLFDCFPNKCFFEILNVVLQNGQGWVLYRWSKALESLLYSA